MAPEYGATCGIFPVDAETLRYLRFTGRAEASVKLVEAYCKEQGLFHTAQTPAANYSEVLELDLGTIEPSLAGPTRPQDRVRLADVKASFAKDLPGLQGKAKPKPLPTLAIAKEIGEGGPNGSPPSPAAPGQHVPAATVKEIHSGSVVIAAITSCTNTSNPSVMLGAGILAKKAVARGLKTKPWVKTSLAPGSKVVTEYLVEAGLMRLAGAARILPGRLRMHDLHWQQRPLAHRDFQSHRGP